MSATASEDLEIPDITQLLAKRHARTARIPPHPMNAMLPRSVPGIRQEQLLAVEEQSPTLKRHGSHLRGRVQRTAGRGQRPQEPTQCSGDDRRGSRPSLKRRLRPTLDRVADLAEGDYDSRMTGSTGGSP